jgi:membrane fusion protein (multidrug efflux system)
MRAKQCVLAAILSACPLLSATGQPNMGPPAVGVVRAERMPIIETNEFLGRIEAISRVSLVARVTAYLDQRMFTEGTEVKQGDLLYKLESAPFEADVLAKQAALAQVDALLQYANVSLTRQQRLLNTPAGQQSNYDNALSQQRSEAAQLLAAQANLRTSNINLAYTEIRAPITGRISRTAVTEGNVVGPTTGTLATIVSQDPMYVTFPVATRAVLDLRARYAAHGGFNAVRVKIRLPTGQIYPQDGKLDYIDPTISTNTDTLLARAAIPNPLLPDGTRALIDGEFVQVLMQGLTPLEVLGVPRAAILSDQQGDYVYKVAAGDKAERMPVKLGQSTPSMAAIISGLDVGDMVISEGIQRVRPGMKVIPGPASPQPKASP